jgi:hypothetical protein
MHTVRQAIFFRHSGFSKSLYVFSVYTDPERKAVAETGRPAPAVDGSARSPDQVWR